MYDDELVLDCESKMEAALVKSRLIKEDWGYQEWSTGSRGTHFHIRVNGLNALSDRERVMYRSKIIHIFGTDMAKKNGFIAIEGKPHFKTGKVKTLISEQKKENKIDMKILLVIKKVLSKSKALNNSNLSNELKEKLRHKWHISDVLSRYGVDTSHHLTMCPLGHPSNSKKCLHFTEEKGLWYCFNCGTGGDVFTLVMEKEDVGFKEALQIMNRW